MSQKDLIQAYQSHKSQQTKHTKLIQHLYLQCIVTMNALQSRGRGETDKRHRALKDNETAQHPNWARNRKAHLWCLCISWPNTDNRGASSSINRYIFTLIKHRSSYS